MTDTYRYGVDLAEVPTGFGISKGVNLFNKGDSPCKYSISLEKVSIDGIVSEAERDTLFLCEDLNEASDLTDTITVNLNPNSTKKFYILHNPISDASVYDGAVQDGDEEGLIKIDSVAYNGDNDDTIYIDVTGKRVVDAPAASNPDAFYALKNWNPLDGYNVSFKWNFNHEGSPFVTGFALELSEDSNFSTLVGGSPEYLPVTVNSASFLPDYGAYVGLSGYSFSVKVKNLELSTNYYARLRSINHNSSDFYSSYVYPSVFDIGEAPNLSQEQITSSTTAPGETIGYVPTVLPVATKTIGFNEGPINVIDLIYQKNKDFFGNPSYNFLGYSGAVVYLRPKDFAHGGNIYGSETYPPLYAEKPETYEFGINPLDNSFKLFIFIDSVNLYGLGGVGSTQTSPSASDGGAIFDFDNLNYTDEGISKIFDYVIVKDIFSSFNAGLGGQAGWIVEEYIDDFINAPTYIEGGQIDYINHYNLIDLDKSLEKEQEEIQKS